LSPSSSGKARPLSKPVASRGKGLLRIIGGQWRRRILPIASVEGLRPTPDRVRETLFNWLGQRLEGCYALDVFAGTGALGLEAVSRGATKIEFIEKTPLAAKQLALNWAELQSHVSVQADHHIYCDNALDWLKGHQQARSKYFDLVFLDPPFRSDLLEQALPLVVPLLKTTGYVYIEWHESLELSPVLNDTLHRLGLELFRADKAGQVHYHLLRNLPA
jgi:16S rRNA (guanine966-N2)-methyltransferase